MSFFKHTHVLKKIATGVLITGVLTPLLFFSLPQKSYAYLGIGDIVIDPTNLVQNTLTSISTVAIHLKDFVLDGLAWNIANMAIQKLTAQTVNWINSGFNGNPAYVTDPGKFFLGLGDTTAAQFLSSDPTLNSLCTPFRAQVRLALVKNYLSETNGINYSCSLGTLENNYKAFVQNFDQGGWNGWFSVTQNTQNNPYGEYLDAKNSLSAQIGTQTAQANAELDWGKGFLSYKKCNQSDPSYVAARTVGGVSIPESCSPSAEQIVTPGSVIQDQLDRALGSGGERLNVVNSINEIVSSLMTELVNKALGATGLLGTSKPSSANGGRSITDLLNPNSPENTKQNAATYQKLLSQTPPELKSPLPTPANAPFIILNGTNPTLVQSADEFADPGATGYDPVDGDISANITTNASGVQVATDGSQFFTVTYNVTDSRGNSANEVTRTVSIVNPTVGSNGATPPGSGVNPPVNPGSPGGSTITFNPTGFVSIFPNIGATSFPIYADAVYANNFTTAADDPSTGPACTANLVSQFQGNPNTGWVDGHTESVTYCGVCNTTTPLSCDQLHYKNCTINFTNTTNSACIPPSGSQNGSGGTTGSPGGTVENILFSNSNPIVPLTFSANQGTNPPSNQFLVIQNGGSAATTIRWTVTHTQSWLSIAPPAPGPHDLSGGGQADTPTISISSASLAAGTYNDTITITAFDTGNNIPTNTIKLPVTLTIK